MDCTLMTWTHWLLSVMFGVCLVRGDTCSDAVYCMNHIDGVREDLHNEDLLRICSKTITLVTCIEASVKDCILRAIEIPPANMGQLNKSLTQAKDIYNGYCHGVTPDPNDRKKPIQRQPFQTVPAAATCDDISQCILDVTAFTDAVANGRSEEACNLMAPSIECTHNALKDCEKSGQMDEDMLDRFKESLVLSKSNYYEFCSADHAMYHNDEVTQIPEDEASNVNLNLSLISGLLVLLLILKPPLF